MIWIVIQKYPNVYQVWRNKLSEKYDNWHYTLFLSDVDTECTREQLRYDKAKDDGTLGQFMHRPECDEDGFYKAVKCLPGQMWVCIRCMYNFVIESAFFYSYLHLWMCVCWNFGDYII